MTVPHTEQSPHSEPMWGSYVLTGLCFLLFSRRILFIPSCSRAISWRDKLGSIVRCGTHLQCLGLSSQLFEFDLSVSFLSPSNHLRITHIRLIILSNSVQLLQPSWRLLISSSCTLYIWKLIPTSGWYKSFICPSLISHNLWTQRISP
jgi:hypothetical protein